MKATQYITDKFGTLRKYPIEPVFGNMNGIKTITLEEKAKDNGFLGFGAAITGSACYNLSLMNSGSRDELLRKIYAADGMGLSIGRLTIGSSDYSKDIYTYDDHENDLTLEHFSIERDMEYIIPIIKEILEINPDLKLFAAPWTPPAWMKTGNTYFGGYMIEKYLGCYAEYLIKYIKAYKENGINIYALTIQNEPDHSGAGKMPCCPFHPEMEAKLVIMLKKRLAEENLETKIWMYDHGYNFWDRIKWQYDNFSELKNASDEIAFHYYDETIDTAMPLFEAYPFLKWHITEGGPRLFERYFDDWSKWGSIIIEGLNYNCSSFTGWNLMLDETGGPNVGPFYCGGFVTRNSQNGELSFSGQYAAYNHFSRFIKPGCLVYRGKISGNKKIKGLIDSEWKESEACATLSENGKLILHIANPGTKKEQFKIFLHGSLWYIEALPETIISVVFE